MPLSDIEELPDDLLLQILDKLDWSDLLSIERVCRHLWTLSRAKCWTRKTAIAFGTAVAAIHDGDHVNNNNGTLLTDSMLDSIVVRCSPIHLREMNLHWPIVRVRFHKASAHYHTKLCDDNPAMRLSSSGVSRIIVARSAILKNVRLLDLSTILFESSQVLSDIGECIGTRLHALKLRRCFEDRKSVVRQEHVDALFNNCKALQCLDISDCGAQFVRTSFALLPTNMCELDADCTWISGVALTQIAARCGSSMAKLRIVILAQVEEQQLRKLFSLLTRLRDLTVFKTWPASTQLCEVPLCTELVNTLQRLTIRSVDQADVTVGKFLREQFIALNCLEVFNSALSAISLERIADLANLSVLKLYYCDNLNDDVLRNIFLKRRTIAELTVIACPRVSDSGFISFIELCENRCRLEGAEQLTHRLFCRLERILNKQFGTRMPHHHDECSATAKHKQIVQFVRSDQHFFFRRGLPEMINPRCTQTETMDLHPWIWHQRSMGCRCLMFDDCIHIK